MNLDPECFGVVGQRIEFILKNKAYPIKDALNVSTILIHGPSGMGKATLVKSLCQKYALKLRVLDSASIFLKAGKDVMLEHVISIFEEFEISRTFDIMLIKDCQDLVGKDDEHTSLIITLRNLFQRLGMRDKLIIASYSIAKEHLHPIWLGFDIHLKFPEIPQREDILLNFGCESGTAKAMARVSGGFRTCDLYEFFLQQPISDLPLPELVKRIQYQLPKSSIQGRNIEALGWNDIHGQVQAKEKLVEASQIITDDSLRSKYVERGIAVSCGIILHGPPGTGKTLLSKALATSCHAHFQYLSIPSIVHAEIGASEKALRNAFDEAILMQPSIIFMDEFDALVNGGDGSGESGTVTEKISNQMIAEFDRLGALPTSSVFVLAATNAVDSIPGCLRRFSRFDTEIYVGPLMVAEQQSLVESLLGSIDSSVVSPTLIADVKELVCAQNCELTGAQVTQFIESAKQRYMDVLQSSHSAINCKFSIDFFK